jgi:hydrogenase maturation protease
VLVAGVGNPWSGDLDLGPRFVRRLGDSDWPDGVELAELALAAPRVLHLLRDLQPSALVLVACYPRGDAPGTVRRSRPGGGQTSDEEVQARLGESAAGVIDLDHILAVTRYYGALPPDSVVIEVEPGSTDFGDTLSPTVEAQLGRLERIVRGEVRRVLSA